MSEDLTKVLKAVLDRPFDDEKQVLSLLVDAILYKVTDTALIDSVVKQTVDNYENKLRVYMIGVAHSQLRRITRMLAMLERIEEEIDTNRCNLMKDSELLKCYETTQTALVKSLEYVKKVADMRIEADQAHEAIMVSKPKEEEAEQQFMFISPTARNRLRKVLEVVVDSARRADDEVREEEDISDSGNGVSKK